MEIKRTLQEFQGWLDQWLAGNGHLHREMGSGPASVFGNRARLSYRPESDDAIGVIDITMTITPSAALRIDDIAPRTESEQAAGHVRALTEAIGLMFLQGTPPPPDSTDWRVWFRWLDEMEELGGPTRGWLKTIAERCALSYGEIRKKRAAWKA